MRAKKKSTDIVSGEEGERESAVSEKFEEKIRKASREGGLTHKMQELKEQELVLKERKFRSDLINGKFT